MSKKRDRGNAHNKECQELVRVIREADRNADLSGVTHDPDQLSMIYSRLTADMTFDERLLLWCKSVYGAKS